MSSPDYNYSIFNQATRSFGSYSISYFELPLVLQPWNPLSGTGDVEIYKKYGLFLRHFSRNQWILRIITFPRSLFGFNIFL